MTTMYLCSSWEQSLASGSLPRAGVGYFLLLDTNELISALGCSILAALQLFTSFLSLRAQYFESHTFANLPPAFFPPHRVAHFRQFRHSASPISLRIQYFESRRVERRRSNSSHKTVNRNMMKTSTKFETTCSVLGVADASKLSGRYETEVVDKQGT